MTNILTSWDPSMVTNWDNPRPAIKSVKWWEDHYVPSEDLSFFLPSSTGRNNPKDSWPLYQLGLGVDGNNRLYFATGNTKYLDRSLLYIENVINRASVSNATNFPGSQFKDGYLGWIDVTHPTNTHGLEQALYEFYMWRYVIMLCYRAKNQSGYESRINNIIKFTEKNIWEKWYRRGVNLWIYRSVVHITVHVAIIALYLRDLTSSATIKAQCQVVLDNIDHAGMPPYGGKSLRTHLKPHPNNKDAYFWKAFWASGDADEKQGSDVNHGEAFHTYAIAAYEQKYGNWNLTDIKKLINLLKLVWPSRGVYYANLIGAVSGDRKNGNFNDGGAGLCGFDEVMQRRLEDHVTAPGSAFGTQLYGRGAEAAARLLGTLKI